MASGRTLWDELVRHYAAGVDGARTMEADWRALEGRVDAERHRAVLAKLQRQVADAAAWRDQILGYFGKFSGKGEADVPPAASAAQAGRLRH